MAATALQQQSHDGLHVNACKPRPWSLRHPPSQPPATVPRRYFRRHHRLIRRHHRLIAPPGPMLLSAQPATPPALHLNNTKRPRSRSLPLCCRAPSRSPSLRVARPHFPPIWTNVIGGSHGRLPGAGGQAKTTEGQRRGPGIVRSTWSGRAEFGWVRLGPPALVGCGRRDPVWKRQGRKVPKSHYSPRV